LSKHPFTIVGVAPLEFHGTLVFFDADLFMPIVNAGQLGNDLNARGNRWVFMTLGHLKAGVNRDQAIADLNSIGSYLEKTYPKEDAQRTFTLARPSLHGDYLGRPMRAFMGALMLLAGLILLAACANLGGLFAARAADRSRELALRLALGAGRLRILRQLFTEAGMLSFLGGAAGIWGSVVLLDGLSAWHPASKWPEMHVAVNPDANVYAGALLLFARKVFGSPTNAVGRYFKRPDGARLQVIGIVEDGKYDHVAEDPQPAMFLPILQAPTSSTWVVVRSEFDSRQLSSPIRKALRTLDSSLPVYVDTWSQGLELALFPSRYGSHGRDALDHRDFRHGGVFREQAAARVGNSYGASRNLSQLGRSGVKFVRIGSCELASLGAVV
jgi:hypothetical protein